MPIELFKKGTLKPINGSTTNAKGDFYIKNLDSGTYSIQIEFIGYNYQDDSIVPSNGYLTRYFPIKITGIEISFLILAN